MTTIACDGRTIAADGLKLYASFDIVQLDAKKLKVVGDRIYAITGSFVAFGPCIDWHMKGAAPDDKPKIDDWYLIVVDFNGVTRYSDKYPYPESMPVPVAFGAGADLALGAMMAGATPQEAVRIAATVTTHTGGEIQTLDIKTAIGCDCRARKLFTPIEIAAVTKRGAA